MMLRFSLGALMHAHTGIAEQQTKSQALTICWNWPTELTSAKNGMYQFCQTEIIIAKLIILPRKVSLPRNSSQFGITIEFKLLTGCCCGPVLTNGKCPQMYFLVVITTRLNGIYVSLILLREALPQLVINPVSTLTLKLDDQQEQFYWFLSQSGKN